jgi:hypothetical protein
MGAQVAQARHAKPGRATDRAPRRFRPHHPRRRQGQRAVDQPYRYVLDASLDPRRPVEATVIPASGWNA